MENAELLAQVKAKINEATEHALNAEANYGMDLLYLYMQIQLLEKLDAIQETLRSIDFAMDATAKIVAKENGYVFLGKKDAP